MDDMLTDAFTDETDKMMSFKPADDEHDKPIYKLFRAFYERTQKDKRDITAAYQFASAVTYEDWLWMIEFVHKMKGQIKRWDVYPLPWSPPGVQGNEELEEKYYTMYDIIPLFEEKFLNTEKNTDDMKKALASVLGSSFIKWIKAGWEELYLRSNDPKAIKKMMEEDAKKFPDFKVEK